MSQSLRQIKSRINSTENTKKIMRAMEMVSVSKLKKVQGPLNFSRKYFLKLDQMFRRLASTQENRVHPFLSKKENFSKIILFVVTSDTGLCGTYNNRILALAEQFWQEQASKEIQLMVVGKKGLNYFRKKEVVISKIYLDLYGRFSGELAQKISSDLYHLCAADPQLEIFFAYTQFKSALRLQPIIEKLFEFQGSLEKQIQYIVEPNPARVWEDLMPEYVQAKIRRVLLEAFTSEHNARVVAMKQATDNAKELLEILVLLRNKLRQYSITKEVIEIISAAEALKG